MVPRAFILMIACNVAIYIIWMKSLNVTSFVVIFRSFPARGKAKKYIIFLSFVWFEKVCFMSKFDVSRLEGARSINKYFTVAHLALYLVNTGVGGNRFRFKVCRKKRKLNGFRRYISVVICAKTCHPSRKMSWYFRNLWCASAY